MGVIEQNKRKKYILVCAAIVFAIGVIFMAWLLYGKVAHGNDNQGGNILAGASPDTSALQMYYFDGETVSVRTFYDSDKEKKLIKRINAFVLSETEQGVVADMKPPFYGIWIGGEDGWGISVAWSEGIWIKDDGTTFYGNADFPVWWEEMAGEDEDDTLSVLSFPNAGILSAYHQCFMVEEDGLAKGADSVEMSIEEIPADGKVKVQITNNSEEEFTYGEYYSLQKRIDGHWYTMPIQAQNVGFHDIARILSAGESAEETYDISIFGALEPGEYRLVVEEISAEFAVID